MLTTSAVDGTSKSRTSKSIGDTQNIIFNNNEESILIMARTLNNFVMGYLVKQNKNAKSPVVGRYFAYTDRLGNITTRGLAEYLVGLGVQLDRSDVEKVLIKMAQAIPGIVAQGYGVKLAGLGIFYATIKNTKGGAESTEDFNIQANIEGVRFRFRPDSSDLDNLTSKAFGRRVSFGNGWAVDAHGNRMPLKSKDQGGDGGDDGE